MIKKGKESGFEYIKPFHGFVLGARPDYKFKLEKTQIKPGDMLFLYTDGVTEAMNPKKKQYSTERLYEKLAQIKSDDPVSANPELIEKSITEDLKIFVENAPASDDITILVFRYKKKMKS